MKLLTTRSVDYFNQPGHDFWKEALLSSFSNVIFGALSTTSRVLSNPIILAGRDLYGLCIQNLATTVKKKKRYF